MDPLELPRSDAISAVDLTVRPLRKAEGPPQPPHAQYTIGADSVYDRGTQLTWQRTVPRRFFSWSEAKEYAAGVNLGGVSSGWRLPTKEELLTLVDTCVRAPAIDPAAFPETPSSRAFWTSSPYAALPDYAWTVEFHEGTPYGSEIQQINFVRCVRR